MPRPSDMIPVEWLAFFDEMYKWPNVPKEQRLQILVEANLSYTQLETLCDIINDNLEYQDEIPEKFERFLRQLGDIICGYDPISNYFWEIKTRQDFSLFKNPQEEFPTDSEDWRAVYELYRGEVGEDMIIAATKGDISVVKDILEAGMGDVNVQDKDGYTALMTASHKGNPEIVRYLLEKGADPKIQNYYEGTALALGSRFGNVKVVQTLLEWGANPNDVSVSVYPPLIEAIIEGANEVILALLNARADPNVLFDGQTPLMIAADENVNAIQILLEAGADPNIQNEEGKTVLDLAIEDGAEEIYDLLRLTSLS